MTNKEFPQQANMPYPYPMAYQDNDEIDLIELFRTLWKQKAKIALVTAATTLAAGIYAFTAEEVWTSKAVFDQPKLEEINEYYNVTQQLKRILQKPTIGEVALEPEKISLDVYDEFKKQIDSFNLRKDFWKTSNYYSEMSKKKDSELNKNKLLSQLTEENIKLELADGKKKLYTSITLSANTALTSKELLEQYLEKVNETVWRNMITELKAVLDQEVADLVNEKKNIKFSHETLRDNNMEVAENAKIIAGKANIVEFNSTSIQGNANINKTDMLFFLGTKALSAQIDVLKNKPVVLPVRYYEIEKILFDLKSLPELDNLNVTSYRYLMSPNEPENKDSPKRILILIAGLIVGVVAGCIGVLLSKIIHDPRVDSVK